MPVPVPVPVHVHVCTYMARACACACACSDDASLTGGRQRSELRRLWQGQAAAARCRTAQPLEQAPSLVCAAWLHAAWLPGCERARCENHLREERKVEGLGLLLS
eukprot:scaffold124971_cov72-Phaeocystis_antarctica.AAC.1